MDNELLYNMIFKRKSFHLFRERCGDITKNELEKIYQFYKNVTPLVKGIRTDISIVKESDTSCSRGGEYCILMYSEIKDHYLENIGYIGEQLDLYLASLDIGALWFGIGKTPCKTKDDMQFVIMISMAKVKKDKFRRDMYKSKRKLLCEIYSGSKYNNIIDVARFSPSACNTQPWYVEDIDGGIRVYRFKKQGKRGIMPENKVVYYNGIDMGIFMLILDVCLNKHNVPYKKEFYLDDMDSDREFTKLVEYAIDE